MTPLNFIWEMENGVMVVMLTDSGRGAPDSGRGWGQALLLLCGGVRLGQEEAPPLIQSVSMPGPLS